MSFTMNAVEIIFLQCTWEAAGIVFKRRQNYLSRAILGDSNTLPLVSLAVIYFLKR